MIISCTINLMAFQAKKNTITFNVHIDNERHCDFRNVKM